jgi:tRNA C32,U32 (ribose-2'-O)-methylase TrmJ
VKQLGSLWRASEYKTYGLDDLLVIRNPDFEREDGQSAQMEQFAMQLAEHAPDVLSGDHRIFPKLAKAIRKRAKKFAKRQ